MESQAAGQPGPGQDAGDFERAEEMLTITVRVDAPAGMAQGVKEALGMYLEQFGDARVTSVTETAPEQMKIGGTTGNG